MGNVPLDKLSNTPAACDEAEFQYFDDPPDAAAAHTERERRILWVALHDLDVQEFRVIRQRLNRPDASLEMIGNQLRMTRQGCHKIVRRLVRRRHPIAFLFGGMMCST